MMALLLRGGNTCSEGLLQTVIESNLQTSLGVHGAKLWATLVNSCGLYEGGFGLFWKCSLRQNGVGLLSCPKLTLVHTHG